MATPRVPSIWGVIGLALVLLVPASAMAQRGGRGGGHGGGMRGSGGSWGSSAGGHVSGFRGGTRGGFVGHGGFGRAVIAPRPYFRHYGTAYWGYPSYGFYGSFGYGYWPAYSYWPGYDYSPPTYVYTLPPANPPVVTEREVVPYEERNRDQARDTSTVRYWLLALQDKSILAVTDYWVEGSTLHYVTRQGTRGAAELPKVDIDFTKELNRGRGLEFQLPRPQTEYQPQRRDAYGRAY